MFKLKCLIKLIRMKQWTKNSFVFMALIFSNNIKNITLLPLSVFTFVSFCFISSFIYIINDLIDCERDKLHPYKKNRPIPNGDISKKEALILAAVLLALSLFFSSFSNKFVMLSIFTYIINNIIYSYWGKNYPIIDVFQISLGFMIRVIAGAFSIWVQPSKWLILCSFFLTLFLGFGKRRGEILVLQDNRQHHRKSLDEYSIDLLDKYLTVSLACTLVFYALYTIIGTNYDFIYISNLFVSYALFKYYFLLMENKEDGNPSDLVLSDWQLWMCVILWILTCILTILL